MRNYYIIIEHWRNLNVQKFYSSVMSLEQCHSYVTVARWTFVVAVILIAARCMRI